MCQVIRFIKYSMPEGIISDTASAGIIKMNIKLTKVPRRVEGGLSKRLTIKWQIMRLTS